MASVKSRQARKKRTGKDFSFLSDLFSYSQERPSFFSSPCITTSRRHGRTCPCFTRAQKKCTYAPQLHWFFASRLLSWNYGQSELQGLPPCRPFRCLNTIFRSRSLSLDPALIWSNRLAHPTNKNPLKNAWVEVAVGFANRFPKTMLGLFWVTRCSLLQRNWFILQLACVF